MLLKDLLPDDVSFPSDLFLSHALPTLNPFLTYVSIWNLHTYIGVHVGSKKHLRLTSQIKKSNRNSVALHIAMTIHVAPSKESKTSS